eukprot:TRINITY_DN4092_c0_g2_i1.p1 TRINITY_DN4092_c0_g2~~TRINITY_DN4092_c0_g2_i1.p1  ORF type:complete len:153 (+),score=20.54 TRINITY_DN4092_c0_g2_i1:53-511(+)
MAKELAAAELAEFQEIFNLVDLDHGGTIDTDELAQLLNTLGLKPSAAELESMIKEVDPDGNGEIGFDAFVRAMSQTRSTAFKPQELSHSFRVFARQDDSPPGFIRRSTLERALTSYGHDKLSLNDANDLLDQLEMTKDGLINYADIIKIMTS